MAFTFVKGRTRLRHLPKTTSTTFTKGDLAIVSSGLMATATAGDNGAIIVGVAVKAVTSGDSDYATAAATLAVEVPADRGCVLRGAVGNGSLLTTSIGVKFGLTSAGAVDFADNTNTDLLCVGFISASLGEFQILTGAAWDS